MSFIKFDQVRIDTDCIEGYYPNDIIMGEVKTKFQIYIIRKNTSEVLLLSFINEQARNDCLVQLDSIFKVW